MAAKLLIDNGLLGGDGDADYSKLLADDELVDQLIDAITRSKMLDKNLTTIINSIIVMATGDKIIEIHEDGTISDYLCNYEEYLEKMRQTFAQGK